MSACDSPFRLRCLVRIANCQGVSDENRFTCRKLANRRHRLLKRAFWGFKKEISVAILCRLRKSNKTFEDKASYRLQPTLQNSTVAGVDLTTQ
jgi:hypothetical protein